MKQNLVAVILLTFAFYSLNSLSVACTPDNASNADTSTLISSPAKLMAGTPCQENGGHDKGVGHNCICSCHSSTAPAGVYPFEPSILSGNDHSEYLHPAHTVYLEKYAPPPKYS